MVNIYSYKTQLYLLDSFNSSIILTWGRFDLLPYNFIANLKGEYIFDVTTQITVAMLNKFSKTVMWSIFSSLKVTLVPN